MQFSIRKLQHKSLGRHAGNARANYAHHHQSPQVQKLSPSSRVCREAGMKGQNRWLSLCRCRSRPSLLKSAFTLDVVCGCTSHLSWFLLCHNRSFWNLSLFPRKAHSLDISSLTHIYLASSLFHTDSPPTPQTFARFGGTLHLCRFTTNPDDNRNHTSVAVQA